MDAGGRTVADDLGDRTEDPTSKRLADARERGQVAKSTDLAAAVGLASAVIAVLTLGAGASQRLLTLAAGLLSGRSSGDEPVWAGSATGDFQDAMIEGGLVVLPFAAMALVVGVVSHVGQVGPLLTTKPLEPKLDRLDPLKGLGRIVGAKNLVRSLLTLLKVSIVLGVASAVFAQRMDRFAVLPMLSATQAMAVIGDTAMELALVLLALLLVLGAADFIYQRWQHQRDLRMTKQQVKDERRNLEGDMDVKRRRLELYRKLAANKVRSATPRADVVITNPTHFAVAVEYDSATMRAPRVTAKGADLLAMEMRRLAAAHGVPIVERPPLARGLYWHVQVGGEISPEHYEAVAEVLAYVYRTDERAAQRRAGRAAAVRSRAA